ncbi:MAG: hypothetical protein ACRYG2_38760 [Janthinobacterium lividum]
MQTKSLSIDAPSTRSGRIVLALAASRTALGVVFLARPRLLPALLRVDPTTSTTMAWAMRMVGGREIALGLGTVAGIVVTPTPAGKRTWLAAGLFSDSTDTIALATAAKTGVLDRRPALIVAASAGALAATEVILLARKASHDT